MSHPTPSPSSSSCCSSQEYCCSVGVQQLTFSRLTCLPACFPSRLLHSPPCVPRVKIIDPVLLPLSISLESHQPTPKILPRPQPRQNPSPAPLGRSRMNDDDVFFFAGLQQANAEKQKDKPCQIMSSISCLCCIRLTTKARIAVEQQTRDHVRKSRR